MGKSFFFYFNVLFFVSRSFDRCQERSLNLQPFSFFGIGELYYRIYWIPSSAYCLPHVVSVSGKYFPSCKGGRERVEIEREPQTRRRAPAEIYSRESLGW